MTHTTSNGKRDPDRPYMVLVERAGRLAVRPQHPGETEADQRARQRQDSEAAVVWCLLLTVALMIFIAGVLVGRG